MANLTTLTRNDSTGAYTAGVTNVNLQEGFTVVKATDQSKTSDTTIAPDSDLSVAIGASETYAFDLIAYAIAGTTAPDIQFYMNVPAGATLKYVWHRMDNQSNPTIITVDESSQVQALNATERIIRIQGTVINSTTAGTLSFDWAQNTSNANATTIQSGSFLRATRVL